MVCYLDTTFCASPNCEGFCGRQFTPEVAADAQRVGLPVAFACFCGMPEEGEPECQTWKEREDTDAR